MNIFIGSSKESIAKARQVATSIEQLGHTVKSWWHVNTFTPSKHVFECLEDMLDSVDAAVFIFGEDDKQWYRGTEVTAVRDNVLLEYGLFCGALGRMNVAICVTGNPRIASDLAGLIWISLEMINTAESKIDNWLKGCQPKKLTTKHDENFEEPKMNGLDPRLFGAWKYHSGVQLFAPDSRGGAIFLRSTGRCGNFWLWKIIDGMFVFEKKQSNDKKFYEYKVVGSVLIFYWIETGEVGIYKKQN